MQTQWSTGTNDGNDDVGVGGGPTPTVREGVVGGWLKGPTGFPVAGTPVDESPGGDAGTGAAVEDTDGEEEAHRSAVDAVDGLLDEVELALARLDDGTYGRCEECGAPIDDARLADSPIERTCGTCVIGDSGPVGADSGAPASTGGPGPSSGPFSHVGAAGIPGD